jgi:hypothetical protein
MRPSSRATPTELPSVLKTLQIPVFKHKSLCNIYKFQARFFVNSLLSFLATIVYIV